jgi:hypothetical protein
VGSAKGTQQIHDVLTFLVALATQERHREACRLEMGTPQSKQFGMGFALLLR